MQTRTFINQTITLLMAAMLLMVAGVKSWSVNNEAVQKSSLSKTKAPHDISKQDQSKAPEGNQAMLSSLSLDAVITPSISFDFYQDFYFIPQQAWNFIQQEVVAEIASREPAYLFSCFCRIFGNYIVTNAP